MHLHVYVYVYVPKTKKAICASLKWNDQFLNTLLHKHSIISTRNNSGIDNIEKIYLSKFYLLRKLNTRL